MRYRVEFRYNFTWEITLLLLGIRRFLKNRHTAYITVYTIQYRPDRKIEKRDYMCQKKKKTKQHEL